MTQDTLTHANHCIWIPCSNSPVLCTSPESKKH